MVGNGSPQAQGSRWRIWVRRYLPAELAGSSAALAAATAAAGAGGGQAVVAASWAESIAFYAFMTSRELRRADLAHRPLPRRAMSAIRDTIAEFGVAEAVDTVLLRPVLMYAFVVPLGVLPGVIAGKLATDAVFYALAIAAYELGQRRHHRAALTSRPVPAIAPESPGSVGQP